MQRLLTAARQQAALHNAYVRCPWSGFATLAPGRVARLTLEAPDVEAAALFFADALGMRRQVAPPGRAALGDGTSCGIQLLAAAQQDGQGAASASVEGGSSSPLLTYPYLTVGVSNLKTSARQARRRGGSVLLQPRTDPASRDAAEAVYVDPSGRRVVALHVFRRNPVVSVTLGCGSAEEWEAMTRFYESALGMRRVTSPEELAQLYLPAREGGGERAVFAYGQVHNTTSLVIELSQPGTPRSEESAPVLSIAVPDAAATHAAAAAAFPGTFVAGEVSAGGEGGLPSFVCYDPAGYVLEVSSLPPGAAELQ